MQHTLFGVNFDATCAWDIMGRMTSLTYPLSGPAYSYQYDSMARLNGMTSGTQQVASAAYNTAGQISSIGYFGFNETRQYNSLNQVTRITTNGSAGTVMDMQSLLSKTGSDTRR
jgi:hypothetical protein